MLLPYTREVRVQNYSALHFKEDEGKDITLDKDIDMKQQTCNI